MVRLSFLLQILVTLLLTFGGQESIAQNLIRNGSFEEFSKFDNYDFGYKTLENNVTTWRNPTSSTPRIYSDEQTAKTGRMFAGAHLYGIKDYREYISSPLNCRLVAGKTYVFRMYVKLSFNSEFALSNFGALFTENEVDVDDTGPILDTPQVKVENTSFFPDKKAWVIVEDSFTAKGNEAFVTIGNFKNDEESISKKVVRMAREGRAYYYIDDIKLYAKDGHDPCQAVLDSTDCNDYEVGYLNLTRDPSFECYTSCPSNVNTRELEQLKHWTQTSGTPDYYNSCSIIMSTPTNIMGSEEPRTGHGYTGLYLFDEGNYREFLTTRLDRTLEKERWYVLKFYAALSEKSGLATDAFEFMVTKKFPGIGVADSAELATLENLDTASRKTALEEIIEKDSSELEKLQPQVINEPGNYGDRYTWKKICAMYLAEGGERYVTMGNFNSDRNTPLKIMNKKAGEFAYYFIDDFTVEPLNDSNMSDCGAGIPVNTEEEELVTTRYFQDLDLPSLLNDEPFTFKGFYFEFDKYQILDTNYYFLDSLIELMLDNPDLDLEVHGHTDDVGSESYNEDLSENRAVSVVNYLISQGIDKKRIKMKYFGAKRPVATNATPEGRQKNRRCEFIIKR